MPQLRDRDLGEQDGRRAGHLLGWRHPLRLVSSGYIGSQALSFSSTGSPSTSSVGDAAANGASGKAARQDHRHGRETSGTPGSSAVADTASAGVAASIALSDHRHGREAFGTVTSQNIGAVASNGAATTLARSDHLHQCLATQAAGAPADAPADGTIRLDSTNSKIYVRIGGAWKSVLVA